MGSQTGSIGYEGASGCAKENGIQFIELPQQWDEIESSPSVYDSPFLSMANDVYPALDTTIVLSINPIDTSSLRVPDRCVGKPFDNPQLIANFCRFVDFMMTGLPDATIAAISIGNEVDGWLADDATKWSQYTTFVEAVRSHIKKAHPDIPVGVKTTGNAALRLQPAPIAAMNAKADAMMITYYPLNDQFQVSPPADVANHIAELVQVAAAKPLLLLEAGFPSGEANGSSDRMQAGFVFALFAAWDQHADAIPMINFVWLHDMSSTEVDALTAYYSVDTPAFASFLATLGLRTNAGIDKPAFAELKQCLLDRQWQTAQ